MQDHRLIDERSLAFGKAIAEKLRQDPTLIQLARDNIQRWKVTCSPGVRLTLDEWREVLDGPMDGVIELLTARDERSTRLRQSNPFAGALSQQERNAIILEFDARDKDLQFVGAMLQRKLASSEVIEQRLMNVPTLTPELLAIAKVRLGRLASSPQVR